VGQSAAAFGWSRHWSVASPASMRRPAARWTHWKFDVKTVKMWFLDNNWDNKRVVSVVNFFKMSCYKSCLVFNCYSEDTDISQGSVVTHLGCGGIYSEIFTANCLLILTVKEFWKSVNIWWSYEVYKKWCHFGPPFMYDVLYISPTM